MEGNFRILWEFIHTLRDKFHSNYLAGVLAGMVLRVNFDETNRLPSILTIKYIYLLLELPQSEEFFNWK